VTEEDELFAALYPSLRRIAAVVRPPEIDGTSWCRRRCSSRRKRPSSARVTPHAFAAVDGPAELMMVFDRDGQHAEVHRDAGRARDG
jgi:hypothetical protein